MVHPTVLGEHGASGDRTSGATARTLLAWIPIPFFLLAMIALWVVDVPVVYQSLELIAAINFIFSVLTSLVVVYLVARSFLVRSTPGLLLLGCGVLIWGASGLVGVLVDPADPNVGVTIHNLCVWLSALCHLSGVIFSIRSRATFRAPGLVLLLSHACALAAIWLVVEASLHGLTPTFFVQGQGGTLMRQFVLGSAIAMFVVTAVLLETAVVSIRSSFTSWYAMALALIAVGLFGVLIQPSVGSLVGWAGRLAQAFSGVYMLVAAAASVGQARVWSITLESALRNSEERFRSFMDHSPAIAWLKDESGRVVYLNRTYEERFGVRLADWLGKADAELWPAETAAEFRKNDLEVLRSGRSIEVVEETGNPDGSRTSWLNLKFLFQDSVGDRYVGGIGLDVSERERGQSTLRESEERFRSAFDEGAVPMALTAIDNRLLRVNAAFCQMVGYSERELAAKSFAEITHPDDLTENLAGFAPVVRGEKPSFRMEKRYIHKDGRILWVDMSAASVRGPDGHPLYMVTHVQDITERKRAEEALRDLNATLEQRVRQRTTELEQRALQLRSLVAELASTEERERHRLAQVLHDHLQQLLVAVKYRASTLRQRVAGDLEPEVDQILDLLAQSIAASRSLTMELSPPVLHDAGLAAGLVWLARWMREKHGLEVDVSTSVPTEPLPEDLGRMVFQAVRELLFNVAKHAEVSRAQVTMTHEQGRLLRVVVADQGTGFDVAAQGQGTARGTFGLFNIRERFALLDGHLEIDSSPGKGTRVFLSIPIPAAVSAGAAESGSSPTSARVAVSASAPGIIRILVADDHTVIRKGLVELLRKEKGLVIVGEAADGQEAVDQAHELNPDVVLMDVTMPRLNGIDATCIISAELPRIRVIGLSMHAEDDMASRMREAGVRRYLVKDGPIQDLVNAIREVCP
jgi:PAS domain S-box-containing protein